MLKEFKIEVEVDQELLNEKAKEFATKALLNEVEEYYTGYNSPFRNAVKEQLKKQEISCHVELPDILKVLNDAVDKEHSSIVEKFINLSFIDDLRSSLQLQPKTLQFSEFLRGVMNADHNEYHYDVEKYDLDIEESDSTKKFKITYQKEQIEVTVQTFDKGKTYEFCRKAYLKANYSGNYTSRINSYLLSLAISSTVITEFDVESFYELFDDY